MMKTHQKKTRFESKDFRRGGYNLFDEKNRLFKNSIIWCTYGAQVTQPEILEAALPPNFAKTIIAFA